MRRIWIVLLIEAAFASGCAVSPPWPDSEQWAEAAAGVEGAIELRFEGEPVDVDESLEGRLTMAEAVRRSLGHDPEVQMALARVRAALAVSHQARLLPNPVVSVVLRWPEGGGSPTVEAGLAADLLSILRKPGEVEAADHRLRSASVEVITTVLDRLAETQSRFIEVQSLDALMPVLDERGKLLDRLVVLAQQRLKGGEGTQAEVTLLEVQRVALDVETAGRRLDRDAARLVLGRWVGQPSRDLAWQLEPWSVPEVEIAGEAQWVQAALQHRPEIQSRVWAMEALGADVRLSRWSPFESLEAGVDFEYSDGNGSLGPSLAIPLPFFDWGQARRERAEADLLEAWHGLTATRRQVVQEVRRAHQAYGRQMELYRSVHDRLMPLLERQMNEVESAFRSGHGDSASLMIAEQGLQAGRTQLIDLRHRVSQAWIELHRAVGGPVYAPDTEVQTGMPPHSPLKEEQP